MISASQRPVDLAALELVVAVASGERGPHSRDDLAALKAGCAGIAAWLRHGQRRDRGDARHAGWGPDCRMPFLRPASCRLPVPIL